MLKDLANLKGFDFSKKIIYTDNLSFDDLFFINEKWKDSLKLDLPNFTELFTPFEDFKDNNYKILYFNKLYNIHILQIHANINDYIFHLTEQINCNHDEYIHIMNNIIDVAISNNHIIPISDLEDKEGALRDYAHLNNSSDDLRDILSSYNLSSEGNKSVLIDRLFDKLTIEDLETVFIFDKSSFDYKLTDEGIKFIKEEYKLYKYRETLPIGFTIDEFLIICKNNPKYYPEEILFGLCYNDWIQFGKNSDSLSKLYKTEVSNVNAEYKIKFCHDLIYYSDFVLELYEKIISEGNCDDINLLKKRYEDYKNFYEDNY